MTDATKAVVWDAYYWPFGEVRSITGSATLNLRFPGQYFLVESGLHYNWNRHYDPSTGRYIQADPNRDVIATQPVNLDGGTLTARSGTSGGSQLPIQIASAGDYNTQIGAELPEFVDGSSVYNYARSSPAMFTDPDGKQAAIVVQGATYCARFPELCVATIAAGINACLAVFNKEHRKGARPSTEEKHESGQARKDRDRGGEKGDERRRPPNKSSPGLKGPWPPVDNE